MKIFRICPLPHPKMTHRLIKKCKARDFSFDELRKLYISENIYLPSSWASEMSRCGFEVFECLYNDIFSQSKWYIENCEDLDLFLGGDLYTQILIEQIRKEKPQIIFLYAGGNFLVPKSLRNFIKGLFPDVEFVSYWGDELAPHSTYSDAFSDCLLNFTSSTKYTKKFDEEGLRAVTLGNCFDPSIAINQSVKGHEFVFSGVTGYGYWDHIKRFDQLSYVTEHTSLALYSDEPKIRAYNFQKFLVSIFLSQFKVFPFDFGYKILSKLPLPRAELFQILYRASRLSGFNIDKVLNKFLSSHTDIDVHFYNNKPIRSQFPGSMNKFMLRSSDYYGLIQNSQVILNIHRDEDADIGNIRCFEATGLGSCLLSDHGDDLSYFLEPNTEFVSYKSAEECVEKFKFLQENPGVVSDIASAGQKRTLRDHTVKNRAEKISAVLKEHFSKAQPKKLAKSPTLKLVPRKRMLATYDLEKHPISFDFMFFLQSVHVESQKRNIKDVVVTIDWPTNFSKIGQELHEYFQGAYSDRIQNMVMQIAGKFENFSFIQNTQLSLRKDTFHHEKTYLFPESEVHHNHYYRIVNKNPKLVKNISASQFAKNTVQQYLKINKNKKLVTLTIRSGPDEIRNSNLIEWDKFLNTLDTEKYHIIVVPDGDNLLSAQSLNKETYDLAAVNFDIRLALYEHAYCNFFVNNGPCVAAGFDKDIDFIMFNIVSEGVPHCSEEFLLDAGYKLKKNPEYHTKLQRWVWDRDKFSVISTAFELFCKDKEKR